MKFKTGKRVLAAFLAFLTVIATMPSNLTLNLVKAADTEQYTFTASEATASLDKSADVTPGTYGTNGYFTIAGSAKRSNSNTHSVEIQKAASGSFEFTVTGVADFQVIISSTGSSNTSDIVLEDSEGNKITCTDDENADQNEIFEYTGSTQKTLKYTDLTAGTYKMYSPSSTTNGSARGFRIYDAVVDQISSGERPPRADWSTVAAPSIGVISAEDGTITVPYKMQVSYDGADKVVVTMKDEAGKETSAEGTKTNSNVTFKPSASGTYTFSIVAKRANEEDKAGEKDATFDFVLPFATSSVLSVANKGNGTVEVEWKAVAEATGYVLSYSLDGTTWTDCDSVTDTKVKVDGLTVGKEYSFKVTAARGEETTVSEVFKATVEDKFEVAWARKTYGNGASESKDTVTGSAKEGAVTITSTSGKLVPGSFDGLTFYYTKVSTSENFKLKAKVAVNSWTLSNAQEGFGLMAADSIDDSGWDNSYTAVASKVEYYWDTVEDKYTTDTTKAKITQKIGIGAQEKKGLTADNLQLFKDGDTATIQANFSSKMYPLEQRYPYNCNIIGNNTADDGTTIDNPYTEFYLAIEKNNTGYFVTFTTVDGKYSTTKKFYDPDALNKIDSEYVYAGFFAARNASATFSEIEFTTSDPATDAPAEERPIEEIAVVQSVQSPKATGNSDYQIVYAVNADGKVTVKDGSGKAIVTDMAVEANKPVSLDPVKLTAASTEFTFVFTANEGYSPGEAQIMETYEPVELKFTVSYKTIEGSNGYIYVSPDGNGNGKKATPASIYEAVKYVRPGQTIVLTEGTYELDKALKIERGVDGTAENMIVMTADPNAKTRPVLDFLKKAPGMTAAGSYWYFYGFDITNSQNAQKGLLLAGNYCVLDNINAYHNGNTGIQLSRYLTTDEKDLWPAYNLILNCTSYGNADFGYEDADGFAAKLTVGDGNVFDGCIAYNNADDGWDLYAKVQNGAIGSVTIKNSIAYGNGYLEDGTDAGNGNGFKMGGDSMSGYHILENCIAFDNKAKGIDSNSCPDIQIKNSISYNNGSYNVALYTNTAKNTDYSATGIISFRENTNVPENFKLLGSQDASKVYKDSNYYWDETTQTSYNTAENKTTVSSDWFVSTDTSTAITRNEDGTINLNGLLELTDKAPEGVGADFSKENLTASNPITLTDGWVYNSSTKKWNYYEGNALVKGWILDGGKYYYTDNDGSMVSSDWVLVGGKYYYMNAKGEMVTGWNEIGGKWYYMNKSGAMVTGWNEIGGKWYYMNAKGAVVTGWNEIGGKWYYMNAKGAMVTGWVTDGGKWYYMNAKGVMVTSDWVTDGGKWYYMNAKGVMVTSDWVADGGKFYYMNTKGVMVTSDWVLDGGKYYYMNAKGVMVTGWNEIGGKWYYMNAKGAMVTGWNEIAGKWYYFKTSGAMATGWNEIGGKWYYFKTSGAMTTGWLELNGKWYYFNNSGAMVTGTQTINGKTYTFDSNGVLK